MSALRSVLREVKDAVLTGLEHTKDKLPRLADNVSDHFRKIGHGVDELDTFTDTPSTPQAPDPHRPGFTSDGAIDAEDFRTPPDSAYYWSGMYPRNGQGIAGDIAAAHDGTTLEMLIDARGIEMPEWDADDPASVATWTQASEAYASGASGTVRAVLGDNLRPDAVWWAELQRLQANPDVTEVVRIHPDTLAESVIWPR